MSDPNRHPTAPGLESELLDVATLVARKAAGHALSRIREHGARTVLRADATAKSSLTDLVTAVDREVEAIIVDDLRNLRPADGIVAEEGTSIASDSGIEWIIDPIDGTTNFLYGHGSFSVSVAAYSGDTGLAGVVYDPIREECFAATLDGGATLNGTSLQAPETAVPFHEVLLGTGFHYLASRRRHQAELLLTILPEVRDIRRQGVASLDLCSVASQRLDAYYEASLKPWDIAAGLIIATEAGYVHEYLDLGTQLEETLVVAHRDHIDQLRALLVSAAEARPAP